MLLEKHAKDLVDLENIARQQGNTINLSIIYITMKCDLNEIQEIINYFLEKGIEIINEDVEPEAIDIENMKNENIDIKVSPFDPSKIDIKMDKLTLDSIIKRIKNNELEFDSLFQRKAGLWNRKQKSQLIESIMLKIPLPAFYFDATDDDKWLIIDGLQRISTIKEFVVDQSFRLTGLEFLSDLTELKYDDLPRSLQRRMEETNINAYLINPATPKNVKYNIFKRINTGGLVLEPQEIRNALFQGQAAEFLLKMSKVDEFLYATDKSIKNDRMLDREFCLRYVAFTQLSLENYYGNLDDFLSNAMEYLSKSSKEDLDNIINRFKFVMKIAYSIFEKHCFRKIVNDGKRRPINKAIFEGISYTIYFATEKEVDFFVKNRDNIRENYVKLCEEYTFQNYLRASDKTSVINRLREFKQLFLLEYIVEENEHLEEYSLEENNNVGQHISMQF